MPSSTAMSENIFNCTEGGKDSSVPDNYEEGWYQDEYGNWLNQFDWKQVQQTFLKCLQATDSLAPKRYHLDLLLSHF